MSKEQLPGELNKYIDTLIVKPGKNISLKDDYHTRQQKDLLQKEESKLLLKECTREISELQEMLYAENKRSVLIILQGMDAAGKDSMIKQVYSGVNPQGVKVTSFKQPSVEEQEHGYLWRHSKALPGHGEMAIFNRSHYENVLVTRVHKKYILAENLPGISSIDDINSRFWEKRFRQINCFEQTIAENGTLILKFFLHVSKEEQKDRFLERIDKRSKNWKFSEQDLEERKHWGKYMEAYEDMLNATSTSFAPWYVLPADSKWFARLAMALVIIRELNRLNLQFPTLPEDSENKLQDMKERLAGEKE